MIKIDKRKARKLYNRGEDVYVLPCKVRPGGMWILPVKMNIKNFNGEQFDNFVNHFEYYNCNTEVGRNASFYTKEV